LEATAYQPEFIVEDVVRLLRVLGLGEVDLLGFSTGGQVAQLIVEAHPQLIRRLVLASTTAYADVEAHLEGWAEYQRRAGALQELDFELSDLEVTTQWAFNGAPLAIWNLDRLDEYLDLLRQVEFSGDWLEPCRTGTLHPSPRRSPRRSCGRSLGRR
jgi:pimeloyl-ACP methyl ester carboxylesterase